MSFLSSNTAESRNMYEMRGNYEKYIKEYIEWVTFDRPNLDHNFIDVWYKKKLYGMVDNNFIPVFPKDRYIKVIENESKTGDVYLMEFVYDAFVDFVEHFYLSCKKQGVNIDNFVDFTIYRGYENPFVSYREHLQDIVNAFWEDLYNNISTKRIGGFHDFSRRFVDYMTINNVDVFTFSGFLESGYNTIYSSGLAFDLSDTDYHNDEKKILDFMDKNIYTIFVESARRYGFLIDKNVPFRLIADLNSKAMQYYIHRMLDYSFIEELYDSSADDQQYIGGMADFVEEYSNIDEYMMDKKRIPLYAIFDIFFERGYNVSSDGEDMMIRSLIISMYNDFVDTEPSRVFGDIDGNTGSISLDRVCRTKKEIETINNEPNWMREYTKFRLYESGIDKTSNKFRALVRKMTIAKKLLDKETTLGYISKRIADLKYRLE